ncbi:MAG: sigma-54-dependent Fis family transcriptional regulator [Candidatus Marinimicrobia bacterium]|nr:sigma-54-dependent Fis family transcriptional regulator [Candidatus Neomarinimicrobiota bacterium]MBL7109993.1 sigma-54-dependent Fis family transcriptional regulator [Candidatus Neomarinimicrobiota bacterium]
MKILIIDDERNIRSTLTAILEDEGYEVQSCESGEKGLETLEVFSANMVLLDVRMSGMDGIETLQKIKETHPNLDVIMISGNSDISTAVEAIQYGAYDFIEKPLSMAKILTSARNISGKLVLEKRISHHEKTLDEAHQIIGNSPQIKELKEILPRIAMSESKVLIGGESGTGKELVAYAIHHLSTRKSAQFVKFNSAAIPNELIESELFGYEKGAFTGAEKSKIGKLELADGGTLFLDEIGDMPMQAQAKILRVIEEGKFERVGGTKTRKIDIRIVAATHKILRKSIKNREFREDLFHRLNVVPIVVPPLRERTGEIEVLINHFLKAFSQELKIPQKSMTKNAMNLLKNHHFPGNVRELKNLVERLYILVQSEKISSIYVLPYVTSEIDPDSNIPSNFSKAKLRFEQLFLEKALQANNWKISQTAESIGMAQPNLSRKIKELGLEKPELF